MRRLAVALLAMALVTATCGDDDAADPGSVDSCEGLAVAGIALLQDTIDIIDDLDIEALAALGESDETPEVFADVEARGDELTARADELGCSDEQMAALMANRAGDLSADSVFGQFILEGVRSGEGGFFDE
ncbi:MAG: hypothetical protein V3V29_06875 [Acidimicrobiia bacterium]